MRMHLRAHASGRPGGAARARTFQRSWLSSATWRVAALIAFSVDPEPSSICRRCAGSTQPSMQYESLGVREAERSSS